MREETGSFSGHGGLRIFYRTWAPEQPKGSVVLVHGANEHSGRYAHVARFFADQAGLAVYALDHRGHGQSEGIRTYVDRFEDYLADLRQFVDLVTAARGKPLMIGHSMGGLISFRYALAYPETIRALVLSSPWFRTKVKPNPVQKALAPLISSLAPKLRMSGPLQPHHVSRDPEVARAYGADPLVAKGLTPRWFTECEGAQRRCVTEASACKLPTLVLQAGDDLVVDEHATRELFDMLPGPCKSFKRYPEKYHEIFNDPGHDEVFTDMLNWLREQDLV